MHIFPLFRFSRGGQLPPPPLPLPAGAHEPVSYFVINYNPHSLCIRQFSVACGSRESRIGSPPVHHKPLEQPAAVRLRCTLSLDADRVERDPDHAVS